jgi:AraC-like DNA-binding protein
MMAALGSNAYPDLPELLAAASGGGGAEPIPMADSTGLPLARFLVEETGDLDRAQAALARAYRDHILEVARPGGRLAMCLHVARLGRIAISAMRFGSAVDIDPGANEDFYVEHFVLAGRTEIALDGQGWSCRRGKGVVISPQQRVTLRVDADCILVGIRVDRPVMKDWLQQATGRRASAPLRFEPEVDLRSGPGAGRHRLLRFLMDELERRGGLTESSLAVAGLEQAYLASLLGGQPHDQHEPLTAGGPSASLRHVRRAEEYIRAHVHEPLTVKTLVSIAGVGSSALYEAFKRHRGTTPMAFLRDARLERVRRDLLHPDASTSVTYQATRWGFLHLGRFSADYRRRFGEKPSETLRRARREQPL